MDRVFCCILLLLITWFPHYYAHPGAGGRVEGKLNVHLVPHTHDDVGWLKTVDQYFYGANNSIQNAGVQYILDTVVQELQRNPNRKFIYVEQAFFHRWWVQQNNEMKTTVKRLVTSGQLEFVNGGWCMHDEAATHYIAMIDQTTFGHTFLKQEFGAVPTIGWQIDPFGHSATQASLLSARVGFDALFFARIDYQDSIQRNADRTYEMIWRPSPSLGILGQVFTGAFERNGYGPPGGFDWDHDSGDAPIQDDPTLEDYNVASRVNDFVAAALDQASANVGDDVMFTMGSDFEYSNARIWFKNLDKLIDYVNLDGRVNAFYSTPSLYVKAKMTYNTTWTIKTDDFFPYADCPHCYWTGYFTSRPALKRYVRYCSGYLNTARQVLALEGMTDDSNRVLSDALGIAQHHDAVSGTSKQHVAYDYAFRLAKGVAAAENSFNDAFANITEGMNYQQCHLLNESICVITQKLDSFVVVAYNSLGRSRKELVKIPVTGPNAYVVYNASIDIIPSQTVPSFMPFPKQQPAPFVLYFIVEVPAFGFNTYYVVPSSKKAEVPKKVSPSEDVVLENDVVMVNFTGGSLSSVTNKKSGLVSRLSQQFLWYASVQRDFQNSGAYIFRPNSTMAYPTCTGEVSFVTVDGPAVKEARIMLCDWVALSVRLSGEDSFVEFEYHIGSIPILDGVGKEVITRFTTDIDNNALYYTDSNGRDIMKRKRDYRPTWPLKVTEPVAGNYYPINAFGFINDNLDKQITILNDRSQGAASINDGQFEIMVHRRTLYDDSRGVGEPLNETDGITPYPNPVRLGTGLRIVGSHYLLLDKPSSALAPVRSLQSRLFSPLVLGFTAYTHISNPFGSAAYADLPPNVELMTFQYLSPSTYLLRLSHQFGVNEDPLLSLPVNVDLSKIFANVKLINIKEVSLTTNQDVKDMRPPFEWKVDSHDNERSFPFVPLEGTVVTINPLDIRTFIVTALIPGSKFKQTQ